MIYVYIQITCTYLLITCTYILTYIGKMGKNEIICSVPCTIVIWVDQNWYCDLRTCVQHHLTYIKKEELNRLLSQLNTSRLPIKLITMMTWLCNAIICYLHVMYIPMHYQYHNLRKECSILKNTNLVNHYYSTSLPVCLYCTNLIVVTNTNSIYTHSKHRIWINPHSFN